MRFRRLDAPIINRFALANSTDAGDLAKLLTSVIMYLAGNVEKRAIGQMDYLSRDCDRSLIWFTNMGRMMNVIW